MNGALELHDVHFSYRDGVPVVRGVSAALVGGRVCALIGPNAAGKSTLIELMLGLRVPGAGRVALDGESVAAMPAHRRASRLAYVPQRPMPDVDFTVGEVVSLGRFAVPREDRAVDEALAVCDLTDLRERVFSQLSVGQQQRVAVARAVAQVWSGGDLAGRFMLLDEPVNAMDLRYVDHTMRVLRGLAARGLGVLVVLHDLNLASLYADTVWLMHAGRVVAAGPRDEVLTLPLLERAYGTGLAVHTTGGGEASMFFVDPSRTLS